VSVLYHPAIIVAPCAGAPTISGCTASEVSFGTCPSQTWRYQGSVTLVGSLSPSQEILWEEQVDRSGSWVTLGRTTSTTSPQGRDSHIGTNGTGASETHYWQVRAYIVPVGAAASAACSGPTTSREISKTGNACLS
jgi:hypothetical protein